MKIRKSTLFIILFTLAIISAGTTYYLLRVKTPPLTNEPAPLVPPRSSSQFLNSVPPGPEAKSSMYSWDDQEAPPKPTSRYEIPE